MLINTNSHSFLTIVIVFVYDVCLISFFSAGSAILDFRCKCPQLKKEQYSKSLDDLFTAVIIQ